MDQTVSENKEVTPTAEEGNPEDIAATMVYLYLPKFQMLLDRLSNKALRRLIYKLVEYPLGEDIKAKTAEEHNAFMIGNKLLEAKYMMIFHTLAQEMEKRSNEVDQSQSSVVESTETQTKENE